MKNLIYIILILTLSCKNQTKQTNEISNNSLTQIASSDSLINSNYYTTKDTVIIKTETKETLKFSRQEYNEIIDNHPKLYNYEYVEEPDQVYYCNVNTIDFSGEGGQDVYYILYAYFLKEKNGIEKYAARRKKIIDIYSNINILFRHFQYGGTGFMHQYYRILGYAEYSIYLYSSTEYHEKTYNISKQKAYYIMSLRQLIDDESKIDFETLGLEKIERTKKLNIIVDDIDELITDIFYLKRAQEFQYKYYEYY